MICIPPPTVSLYPGVEVHANIVENILQQDFLERPSWVPVLDMTIILVTGILLGLVALYFKAIGTAVLLGVGVGGYLVFDYLLSHPARIVGFDGVSGVFSISGLFRDHSIPFHI